jgi:hypothetical protein
MADQAFSSLLGDLISISHPAVVPKRATSVLDIQLGGMRQQYCGFNTPDVAYWAATEVAGIEPTEHYKLDSWSIDIGFGDAPETDHARPTVLAARGATHSIYSFQWGQSASECLKSFGALSPNEVGPGPTFRRTMQWESIKARPQTLRQEQDCPADHRPGQARSSRPPATRNPRRTLSSNSPLQAADLHNDELIQPDLTDPTS